MEAANIPEFKALIERYESITLKEIKEKWAITLKEFKDKWINIGDGYVYIGYSTANLLTGFGKPYSCTLCIACKQNCYLCVYGKFSGCFALLPKSYKRIENSTSPKKLLNAFHNRAKVLREFAKKNNINID